MGDARRTERLIRLVDELSVCPTGSIPLACGGWPETKATYRKDTPPQIAGHRDGHDPTDWIGARNPGGAAVIARGTVRSELPAHRGEADQA
ncbi:MAG: hypothetical protein KDJ70_01460 [Candidatus Competibacteraceae bacterium]|nr:hypothetical protein [Candidatus Competibacteraceae bacterium]